MDNPTATHHPASAQTPSAPADSLDQQAERAQQNKGDTVRASWNFSGDAIRANIAHVSPEAKELLVWAFAWCIDPAHPIHFREFADRIGMHHLTLRKIYSGTYTHPETGVRLDLSEKYTKAIRGFRRLELARAKMGAQDFIRMPTALRIYWAIDQARKSGRPVMIFGGSQIGKTEACRQNAIEFNHGKTILVEIEAVSGLRGLLQAIAVKLGISPDTNTPDLIKRIKKALTRDMVLILDEVHLLANVYRRGSFFACMEEIRRIWDHCKCGLVMTFTELGYEQAAEQRKRELMQVFRRAVFKVNLGSAPSVADIKAFAESYDLPWDDRNVAIPVTKHISDTPIKALKLLANEEGLTAIIERARLAHELAADDGRTAITWRDFMVAHYSVLQQAEKPSTGWDKEGVAA